MHVSPDFEQALGELMRRREIATKSEAIRIAVQEAVARLRRENSRVDYRAWIGIGLAAPTNPHPRFGTHDDLWE